MCASHCSVLGVVYGVVWTGCGYKLMLFRQALESQNAELVNELGAAHTELAETEKEVLETQDQVTTAESCWAVRARAAELALQSYRIGRRTEIEA